MTMTVDLLAKALPSTLRSAATQNLVDILNTISAKPEEAEVMRETFLSYSQVLQEGKYKMEDYLNAVKYVSFKLMNHTNEGAYIRTFPQRYQALKAKGTSPKDIGSYVHAYSKNKLVTKLLEQALVPTYLLNQDVFQEAINIQASIMRDEDVSPKVRVDAANSLLTHLAKPKETITNQNTINLDLRDSSGTNEMRKLLADMAAQQQAMIAQGFTAKELAAQRITIDVEATDVSN